MTVKAQAGPPLTARPASAVKVMTTPMRSLKTPAIVRRLKPDCFLVGSVDSINECTCGDSVEMFVRSGLSCLP
jgi:hypothetical protein